MSMMSDKGSIRTKKPPESILAAIFGGNVQSANFNNEGAKKVNPKVFFANERTFLKWMNVSTWVAAISIGLSSFSSTNGNLEALSSLLFLAMAIIIVCYSMFQCK